MKKLGKRLTMSNESVEAYYSSSDDYTVNNCLCSSYDWLNAHSSILW